MKKLLKITKRRSHAINDLLERLIEVQSANPQAKVYLTDLDCRYVNFSGFHVDDNLDVTLDIVHGDEPA